MGSRRIISDAVVMLGLSTLVFAAGCKSGPEREKVSAPQEGLASSVEVVAPAQAEGECPALRAAIDPKQCEDLPPFHGLSPKHPGEWGADPSYVWRLVCADGTSAGLLQKPPPRRRGPSAEEDEAAERVQRFTATCDSKLRSIYVRENACGNPCPPQGFKLMSSRAHEAIRSTANRAVRDNEEALIAALEEAKSLAPDVERVYTTGFYRLQQLELHEQALQFVDEGLQRFPASPALLELRSEARTALEKEPANGSTEVERTRVRYSRDPSETGEDRCEDLPEGFGLSLFYPLETGGFLPVGGLVCSDGTMPMQMRQGNAGKSEGSTTSPSSGATGREPADIVDVYTVQCASRTFTVYTNMYRSGRPCAPRGLRLLPTDALEALARSRKYRREEDLAAAIEEAYRARQAAPDVERVHIELLNLMLRGHDIPEALAVVTEGVKGVPESASLRLSLAGLLLRFERAQEAEKEIDVLLGKLNKAGDQSFRPAALCTKASISHFLGKTEEMASYRKEACEWGAEACCASEQGAAGQAAR